MALTERLDGYPAWAASDAGLGVEVRFTGRGPEPRVPGERLLERFGAAAPGRLAWATQVHSARALEVTAAGAAGEGDALCTRAASLALAVFTADCLPILLAAPGAVAAVHAGWRGLVAGVIANAIGALGATPARAWIGPTIGACCYEVGEEVGAAVSAASAAPVLTPGQRGRPHLDLAAVARHQLVAAGLAPTSIETIERCTRCQPDELWSYRRDGKGCGRNVAFIWRS